MPQTEKAPVTIQELLVSSLAVATWTTGRERKYTRNMTKKLIAVLLVTATLALVHVAEAQQPKAYRVGVILPGGAWYETIDGLRVGLKQLGLEDKRQVNLVVRETGGAAKAAEEAAKNFEREKVDLVYTTATSVTIAARRATEDIPIVFNRTRDVVD